MDNEQIFSFDVTCHNDECQSAEIVITIETPEEEPIVICGPCGVEITDIVPILHEV